MCVLRCRAYISYENVISSNRYIEKREGGCTTRKRLQRYTIDQMGWQTAAMDWKPLNDGV